MLVTAHPNAGLPNAFGEYDLDADTMAKQIREWAQAGFLDIVGGCCGTTPQHIAAMSRAVEGLAPRKLPEIPVACRLSGLEPLNIGEDSLFVNVGERANVTGSAKFKRLIKKRNTARHWMWPASRWKTVRRLSISTWMKGCRRRSGDGAFSQSDCR